MDLKALDEFNIASQNGIINSKTNIKYLGVMIDNKLSWDKHIQYVEQKLCTARGILNKIKYYAPQTVLRSGYFGLVYPYLKYCVTSWGNAALKYINKIQVQQNYIVKTLARTNRYKTKLLPLYNQLNLLKLNQIFELEVLKFVFKFKNKLLPICFNDYFRPASEIHRYSTRFSTHHNWAAKSVCNKAITKRSLKYVGYKIWNDLPNEIKNNCQFNIHTFSNKVKIILLHKQTKI